MTFECWNILYNALEESSYFLKSLQALFPEFYDNIKNKSNFIEI